MNICVPVETDNGLKSAVCAHFGSAPAFMIVDTDTGSCRAIVNGNQHHGHGMCMPLQSLQGERIDGMVVGEIGMGALNKLNASNIKVYISEHTNASPRVIGRIRTPFVEGTGTPIQPAYAEGAEGQVIIDVSFAGGLDDFDGFERLWLIYWMDKVSGFKPHVVPYRDTRERGLFATRSPCRPNPIGLSVVRLLGREGCVLRVADVDILDDTPLLDIKPYVPEFDAHPSSKAGWFEACAVDRRVADGRFHAPADSTHGGRR